MKISKLIAIVGSVLILVCFFLPWESLSFMGTEIVYSGFQKAAGSPPGNYKLSVDPSDYGAESDLEYINQVWGELLGGTLSGSEIGAISGITDAINRAFAKPILYIFPVAAILVVVFSILSNRKPHISFGIIMAVLAVILGIILFANGKSMAMLMNLGDLAGSVLSLFGMQELVPKSQFEIGFFGTVAGLLAFLVAGFLGWQDYSNAVKAPEKASFQNVPGYRSQNQYYPQQYPSSPPQSPQPQGRPDGAYLVSQDQSVFLYQQNQQQYQNYQQSAPPAQQQSHYIVYPNAPQPGSPAPRENQQSPYYQPQPPSQQQPYPQPQSQPQSQPPSQQPVPPQPQPHPQPQQPVPPQQNVPNNPVAGWRAIQPPKDPRE